MPPTAKPSGAIIPLRVAHPVPDRADLERVLEVWRGRLSPLTAAAYDAELAAFGAWLADAGRARAAGARDVVAWLISQGKIGAEAVAVTYLGDLAARGLASASIRHHRAALRSAVKTCELLGLCPWRLEALMPRGVERKKRRQTAGPSLAHLRAILAAAASQPWRAKALRDVALLRLVAALRVRGSEVCRLKVKDYAGGAVTLVLKGHREGVAVAVPAAARAAVDAYLAERGRPGPDEALFASLDPAGRGDGRLTRAGLHQLVVALAARAGVPGPVSPHRLLHTASTALTEAGVSTDDLQLWGRWEKRETAETYMDSKQRVAERLAEQVDGMLADAEEGGP